jgi:Na+/melibiose symporter-like transporter
MQLSDMGPVALSFVFIAIVIGVGATILGDVQSSQTADGYAYNTSASGLEGLSTLGSWLPVISLVVAAAIVISVLSFFRK